MNRSYDGQTRFYIVYLSLLFRCDRATQHRHTRTALEAAARLISASPGQDVPLRAICDEVGVKLPTLYHFFGNKEGLLEAVIEHGFDIYLSMKSSAEQNRDPIQVLRNGWDTHTRFGLDSPGFYALMYGQVTPHRRPAAAARPYEMLLGLCRQAGAEHRLAGTPEEAANHILAANVGVTLFLITSTDPDITLSERMRDATMAAITGTTNQSLSSVEVSRLAQQILVHLPTAPRVIDSEETALLRKWLSLISTDRR